MNAPAPIPPPAPISPGGLLRRFVRERKGATVVEFALVALPFFALIFAILETALVFFAGQVLETAVADTGRLVMTGQVQSQGISEAEFKERLCDRVGGMFDCEAGVQVDVRVLAGFAAPERPVNEAGELDTSGFAFQPGQGGDIVLVRAVYEWPVVISLLGLNLADMPNGRRLVMATSAFRNEPFGAIAAAGQ